MEGSNIFNYRVSGSGGRDNLFYSRRIGRRPHLYPETTDNEYVKSPEFTRILGAFKLSGKTQNGWSIGLLESVTNQEYATIDNNGDQRKVTVEPLTNFVNARLQKDINKGKTIIGGIFTATNRIINDSTLEFLPTSAYTGGLDFEQFWEQRTWNFKAKIVGSSVTGSNEAITDLQEAPQRYYQRPDATHRNVDRPLAVFAAAVHDRVRQRFAYRSLNLEFTALATTHLSDDFHDRLHSRVDGVDVSDQAHIQTHDQVPGVEFALLGLVFRHGWGD